MRTTLQLVSSLASLAAFSGLASSASTASSPPIRAHLQANFAAPPLVLEIAEGIAAYNSSAFFPFILKLANNKGIFEKTDADAYAQALQWVEEESFLRPFALSLLKLELSSHTYAPAVAAQYQLYNATVVPDIIEARGEKSFDNSCSVWAQYKDKQACNVEALGKLLDVEKFYGTTYIEEAKVEPERLAFDHVYQSGSGSPAKVVALYADPRADNFIELHSHLMSLADNSEVTYILRYRPWELDSTRSPRTLGLSGYGVELALKSTEYKVIDDRDLDYSGQQEKPGKGSKLAVQGGGGSSASGRETVLFEDEAEPAVKGLPEKLMSAIGIQATQMILTASDKLSVLKQLSQDLPRYAHLLSGVTINETLSDQIGSFRQLALKDTFLINGLKLSSDELDPFQLLEHIRREDSVISSLESAGLTQKQALELVSAGAGSKKQDEIDAPTFDMRDTSEDKKVVAWLNNLEKDNRYAMWPSDIRSLLRIYTPGQIQRLRKNTVQLIFALDLSLADSWAMVFDEIASNIEHGLPMQFGVVPLVDYGAPTSDSPSNQMAKFYQYLRRSFKKKEVTSLLTSAVAEHRKNADKRLSFVESTRSLYNAYARSHKTRFSKAALTWDQIMKLEDSWLETRWEATVQYCSRLDLSPASSPEGMVFVNGVAISLGDSYQSKLFNTFQLQTWELAQALRRQDLGSEDNIQEYVYSRPNVLRSRSSVIYPSDEAPLKFLSLGAKPVQQWIDKHLHYLEFDDGKTGADGDKHASGIVSLWVVGDFAYPSTRKLAVDSLEAAKLDKQVRVALVHVPFSPAAKDEFRAEGEEDAALPDGHNTDVPQALYQLISASSNSGSPAEVAAFVKAYLANPDSVQDDTSADGKLAALAEPNADAIDDAELAFAASQEALSKAGLALADTLATHLVVNGRVLPAITPNIPFTKDSVASLVSYELSEHIEGVRNALVRAVPEAKAENDPSLVMKISAILGWSKTQLKAENAFQKSVDSRRIPLSKLIGDKRSTLVTVNDPETSRIRIQAILDPLSENAQKWAPVLQTLTSLPGISLELWLSPDVGMTELPVKRFYRYLWNSELEFSSSTGEVRAPEVVFNGVPADPLLTLGMDVPSAWLVTAVESIHDLDNIRLSSVRDTESGISATYKLANILVEGHLVETGSRSPPRGLEVRLGTSSNMAMTDTIVMANLGYLQLKASPGVWKFTIRPGRSADIYKIDNISESRWNYNAAKRASADSEDSSPILVTSFTGTTVFPLVSKRAGHEKDELLQDTGAGSDGKKSGSSASSGSPSSGGLWGKLKGAIGSSVAKPNSDRPHFDVFAVASGHLYERLMSIMILSVLKNTKSHVKFWLIENFLSPSFKAFVPHMAEEYGFDYEFVTYKWPHWLNHETEKQRTIWGYKILFLDVLFPLNLDRVIFVDADQIVRADLQELADIDLHGAPYGYVPFCDDRKEIEGYRFWKQGWWKDHLRDKPYHISALYVVDLKRFRQLAAGDRLRGQYQALSRDSSSLANLDQDLPNNMQHVVPIHSLPQEWLWCETWCSDASLKKAKTIDLCNNPMTKEPKLERARRLLPEWEAYDKQIANFTRSLVKHGKHEGAQIADAEPVNVEQPASSKNNGHDEL
ncbi:killer toxin resistant protein [Dipsacomyces acuminosporus]|nr:killer toxin resistant protein [Dipsacomyces acuminosporus]